MYEDSAKIIQCTDISEFLLLFWYYEKGTMEFCWSCEDVLDRWWELKFRIDINQMFTISVVIIYWSPKFYKWELLVDQISGADNSEVSNGYEWSDQALNSVYTKYSKTPIYWACWAKGIWPGISRSTIYRGTFHTVLHIKLVSGDRLEAR